MGVHEGAVRPTTELVLVVVTCLQHQRLVRTENILAQQQLVVPINQFKLLFWVGASPSYTGSTVVLRDRKDEAARSCLLVCYSIMHISVTAVSHAVRSSNGHGGRPVPQGPVALGAAPNCIIYIPDHVVTNSESLYQLHAVWTCEFCTAEELLKYCFAVDCSAPLAKMHIRRYQDDHPLSSLLSLRTAEQP